MEIDKPNLWLLWASLLGIAVLLIFAQANAPSLDIDGVHYAAVSEEMARTGRLLYPFDPVVNGPYYWHFPMSLWPNALMMALFGVSPLTAKLYSMLMTLAAVAGLFLIGRKLSTPWAGWCAGIAFLLTNHVLKIARQCRVDLPVTAFVIWAFFGFILAQKRSRKWYLLYGAACLGAIMTKEVVGLVPLVVGVAYLLLQRKWKELFHPAFLAAWALAILPVVGWICLEQKLYGDTLFHQYRAQNYELLMYAKHLAKPWWYYGWAIWHKYWYLLPLALAGGWIAWGRIRRKEEPLWWVVLLWAAAFPIGFSLASNKIHYYILPSYAATALLVGLAGERWIQGIWRERLIKGLVLLAVAVTAAITFLPIRVHKPRYADNIALVPRLDPILRAAPAGEFIVVNSDVASLLFYSGEVTRVTSAHHWPSFQDKLGETPTVRRYCLIGFSDWALLDPKVREKWTILLNDGKRYMIRQEPGV